MNSHTLAPIPWTYDTSDIGTVWRWENDTFVATVTSDERSFYWTLSDKSADPSGDPRLFAESQANSFESAERGIRETVGKAYSPLLGFRRFAGALATTFMLGTGETVDLGIYTGRKIRVTVAQRDASDEVVRGIASVEHYELLLTDGDDVLRILPSFIVDITPEGVKTPVVSATPKSSRTVQGRFEPGCTGRPGFLANTVEHDGAPCPLHEETGRRVSV